MLTRALSILRRWAPAAAMPAAMLLLGAASSGCTSDRHPRDVTVPQSPTAEVTVRDADEPEEAASVGPDGYPTFAAPLTAANSQLTNDEAAAISGKLSALSRARRAGTVSEAEYQRQLQVLRKLAAEHGVDAAAAIGN
ncbi:hypothetical protein M8R20_13305 [Pseudomonas sp. R2.Fl]|nr:hypothetical protein [Pseudomonas sp. R2.Fl]